MIVNVVLSGTVLAENSCEIIQLENLTNSDLLNIRYDKSKFCAAIIKISGATILLFKNGKVICSGTKTESSACLALNRLIKILRENFDYQNVALHKYEIVNVVAARSIESSIDLELFKKAYVGTKLEREFFPGACFKTTNDVTVVAFSTGKFYCTGARTIKTALEALEEAESLLLMFQV